MPRMPFVFGVDFSQKEDASMAWVYGLNTRISIGNEANSVDDFKDITEDVVSVKMTVSDETSKQLAEQELTLKDVIQTVKEFSVVAHQADIGESGLSEAIKMIASGLMTKNEAKKFMDAYFQNSAYPGGWLEPPEPQNTLQAGKRLSTYLQREKAEPAVEKEHERRVRIPRD